MTRNALFIGGTKGLGHALSQLAIADLCDVSIAGRTAHKCDLVREGRAMPFIVDLESEDMRPWVSMVQYDVIVWAAGIYQDGAFTTLAPNQVMKCCRNHLVGPIALLTALFRSNKESARPCHLVVIGSSSAYRVRTDESLYGALKAAKAQLARNLGKELPRDLPGSKVLLANPGGMATPFWDGRDRDVSSFMDPKDVARVIWDEVRRQDTPFLEIQVIRQADRSPKVEYGPRLPE